MENKQLKDILSKSTNSEYIEGATEALKTLKQFFENPSSFKPKKLGDKDPFPELKKPKMNSKEESSDENSDSGENSDSDNNEQNPSNKNKQSRDNEQSGEGEEENQDWSELDPDKIKELTKKALEDRNSEEDVIDDNNNALRGGEVEKNTTEHQRRLDNIKKFNSNDKILQDMKDDKLTSKKLRELSRQAELARKATKWKGYPSANIDEIAKNIAKCLKTEAEKTKRDSSYSRYNPRSTSSIIRPGRYNKVSVKIPTVVFYFDMSGSWTSNDEKIQMGYKIENALWELVEKKKIKLERYYFATKTGVEKNQGVGNSDAPYPHIRDLLKAKKLDNLIIMTDRDPSFPKGAELKIPGNAWLLFYDDQNDSIIDSVSAVKHKYVYMIDHK